MNGPKQGYIPDEDGFGFEFDGGQNEIVEDDESSASESEQRPKPKVAPKKIMKNSTKNIDIDSI